MRELAALVEHRPPQVANLLKVLDYKSGEQVRNWYREHTGSRPPTSSLSSCRTTCCWGRTAHANPVRISVPARHRVRGRPPGVRLGLGLCIVFAVVMHTKRPVRSRTRRTLFSGVHATRQTATAMSERDLIEPLANGINDPQTPSSQEACELTGRLRTPIVSAADATKGNLLATLTSGTPPSLLFTASHGLWPKAGAANQLDLQGRFVPGLAGVRHNAARALPERGRRARRRGRRRHDRVPLRLLWRGHAQYRSISEGPQRREHGGKAGRAALRRRPAAAASGASQRRGPGRDRSRRPRMEFSIRPPSAAGPQIRTFINTIAFTLTALRRASRFSKILADATRRFR